MAFRLLMVAAGLILLAGCRMGGNGEQAYVGSSSCASCHAAEYEAWRQSDHAFAMSEATDSTVLGNFDDAIFEADGMTSVFRRAGSGFIIESHETDGTVDTLRVVYTFGYDPLQQYLVEYDRGRLQSYTIAWNSKNGNWFSLYPGEALRRGEYVHWSGAGMNWNYMCAECHSTDLKKGYDPPSDTYATTFGEINVACEACHGPGEAHQTWARKHEKSVALTDSTDREPGSESAALKPDGIRSGANYGLTVALSHASTSDVELDVCARCHSRRTPISDQYVPGDAFLDHYRLSLLEEGLYFSDGQIDDEVYVYGSFLQSKMHRRGIRCSDCHNAHSGAIKLRGNALCAQCHVATTYDTMSHLQHEEGSEASQCVTCHMPRRTYMQVDPRRDHSFKVPHPIVSERIGAPDVCGRCHTDQSPETLDQAIRDRYPDRSVDGMLAVADIFADGRRGVPAAAAGLNTSLKDTSIAAITRATAVSLLGRYPVEQSLGAIARELRNADPLVRLGALQAADDLGPLMAPSVILPLLEDSIYGVRIEAARLLALRRSASGGQTILGLDDALDAYRASLAVNADQPGTYVNLAVLEERLGDRDAAQDAYENALRLDSTFYPALVNYGLLLNGIRNAMPSEGHAIDSRAIRRQAEKLFRRAAVPENALGGRASYYLGLLLAEEASRLSEAATELERAAILIGTDGRIFYNAGLAFQTLGEAEKAVTFFVRALALSPVDPDPVNALVILHMQKEDWNRALQENDRLAEMVPNDSGIEARRQYILGQIAAARTPADDS